MEPTDNDLLKARARRAYERARIRRGLLAAVPVIAIALIGGRLAHDMSLAVAIGAAMFAIAAVFFWRGQGWGRGVLPGIAAGAIPFVAMHAAEMYGHACGGSACFSVCIPIASASGVVAGLLIGRFARRAREVRTSWVSAGTFAGLTGALACACVGVGGLIGLVVGLVVGSLPFVVRPVKTRA